jgi:hypothetical protein
MQIWQSFITMYRYLYIRFYSGFKTVFRIRICIHRIRICLIFRFFGSSDPDPEILWTGSRIRIHAKNLTDYSMKKAHFQIFFKLTVLLTSVAVLHDFRQDLDLNNQNFMTIHSTKIFNHFLIAKSVLQSLVDTPRFKT